MMIQARENVFNVLVQTELLLAQIIVKTVLENIVRVVTQAINFHTMIQQKADVLIGNVRVKTRAENANQIYLRARASAQRTMGHLGLKHPNFRKMVLDYGFASCKKF